VASSKPKKDPNEYQTEQKHRIKDSKEGGCTRGSGGVKRFVSCGNFADQSKAITSDAANVDPVVVATTFRL
jgi:hypothetical protein